MVLALRDTEEEKANVVLHSAMAMAINPSIFSGMRSKLISCMLLEGTLDEALAGLGRVWRCCLASKPFVLFGWSHETMGYYLDPSLIICFVCLRAACCLGFSFYLTSFLVFQLPTLAAIVLDWRVTKEDWLRSQPALSYHSSWAWKVWEITSV